MLYYFLGLTAKEQFLTVKPKFTTLVEKSNLFQLSQFLVLS
jgi:hypothetical protein